MILIENGANANCSSLSSKPVETLQFKVKILRFEYIRPIYNFTRGKFDQSNRLSRLLFKYEKI